MVANIAWDLPKRSKMDINPLGYALDQYNNQRTQEATIAQQQLANQKSQAQQPYWGQQAQADLQQSLLANEQQKQKNQYYPTDIQSQIVYRNEQRKAKELENQQQKYFADRPWLKAPPNIAMLEYLDRTGDQNQNNGYNQGQDKPNMSLVGGGEFRAPQTQLANGIVQQQTPSLRQQARSAAYNEAIYGNKQSPAQVRENTQAATSQKQLNDDAERLSSDRESLVMGLQNLEQFHNAYKENKNSLFGRQGSLGGTLPVTGWSTALGNYDKEQAMDNTSNYLQGEFAQHLSPRMTNMIVKLAGTAKINRAMDPGVEDQTYNKMKSAFVRGLEEQEAVNYMTQLGVPYKQQRELWTLYNTNLPLYDVNKNQMNTKNMNQFQNFMKVDDGKIVIHKTDGWYEL